MYILKTRIFQKVGNFRNFGENNRNLEIFEDSGNSQSSETWNFHENTNFRNFNRNRKYQNFHEIGNF